jgi:hypothetical protein
MFHRAHRRSLLEQGAFQLRCEHVCKHLYIERIKHVCVIETRCSLKTQHAYKTQMQPPCRIRNPPSAFAYRAHTLQAFANRFHKLLPHSVSTFAYTERSHLLNERITGFTIYLHEMHAQFCLIGMLPQLAFTHSFHTYLSQLAIMDTFQRWI